MALFVGGAPRVDPPGCVPELAFCEKKLMMGTLSCVYEGNEQGDSRVEDDSRLYATRARETCRRVCGHDLNL